MLRVLGAMLIGVVGVQLSLADDAGNNWPRYRGPDGTGYSTETDLPVKWDNQLLEWETDLPVAGQSSPVVWGDRIFLTGFTGTATGVRRHVLCVDRGNGEVLWNKTAEEGRGEKLHEMNSWATPSCATDGERVVAFFGRGGLHCYDLDGKPMWSRDLGQFPGAWGVGASPIILGDLIIQNCDAEGNSFLLAVNKDTGKDVWKTPRRDKPRGGWSTPILIETGDRQELLLNGEFGVQSYDPANGKPYWFCKSFNGRGTPIPAWGHGLLYVVNGKPGDIYAVRPGGDGDVTATHMQWHTARRGGRDLASPVLVGDVVVVIGMKGIATGYDATTGNELWKDRVGGRHSGSPVVANGMMYVLDEDGYVSVVRAGKQFEVLARNRLGSGGEVFRSSMAVSDGQFIARSDKRIYCVGKRRS